MSRQEISVILLFRSYRPVRLGKCFMLATGWKRSPSVMPFWFRWISFAVQRQRTPLSQKLQFYWTACQGVFLSFRILIVFRRVTIRSSQDFTSGNKSAWINSQPYLLQQLYLGCDALAGGLFRQNNLQIRGLLDLHIILSRPGKCLQQGHQLPTGQHAEIPVIDLTSQLQIQSFLSHPRKFELPQSHGNLVSIFLQHFLELGQQRTVVTIEFAVELAEGWDVGAATFYEVLGLQGGSVQVVVCLRAEGLAAQAAGAQLRGICVSHLNLLISQNPAGFTGRQLDSTGHGRRGRSWVELQYDWLQKMERWLTGKQLQQKQAMFGWNLGKDRVFSSWRLHLSAYFY